MNCFFYETYKYTKQNIGFHQLVKVMFTYYSSIRIRKFLLLLHFFLKIIFKLKLNSDIWLYHKETMLSDYFVFIVSLWVNITFIQKCRTENLKSAFILFIFFKQIVAFGSLMTNIHPIGYSLCCKHLLWCFNRDVWQSVTFTKKLLKCLYFSYYLVDMLEISVNNCWIM